MIHCESEASLANRFAYGCFKKADVDIKLDNSNTMDDWNRLKLSFAKRRFYNGSPLIEVKYARNHRLWDKRYFRNERSSIWMTCVLIKFKWVLFPAIGPIVLAYKRRSSFDHWTRESWNLEYFTTNYSFPWSFFWWRDWKIKRIILSWVLLLWNFKYFYL